VLHPETVATHVSLLWCAGKAVWINSLTVIVINPKRQRGGGAKPAAAQVWADTPGLQSIQQSSGAQQHETVGHSVGVLMACSHLFTLR
jgi:hypothetical protein